jgi:hypothetical protein
MAFVKRSQNRLDFYTVIIDLFTQTIIALRIGEDKLMTSSRFEINYSNVDNNTKIVEMYERRTKHCMIYDLLENPKVVKHQSGTRRVGYL